MCTYLQIRVAVVVTHVISCTEIKICTLNHSHLKLQLKCMNKFFKILIKKIFFINFKRINILNLGWEKLLSSTKKYKNYCDTFLWRDFVPTIMVSLLFLLSSSGPKSRSKPKSYNICSCE